MLKALLPVDGSENSLRAVKHLINLVQGREPMDVHILNVQEGIDAWEVKRCFKAEEIEAMQVSAGVALSNLFPEAKSVGRWLRHGWFIAIAYVVGYFVMLAVAGWEAHAPHKDVPAPGHAEGASYVAAAVR